MSDEFLKWSAHLQINESCNKFEEIASTKNERVDTHSFYVFYPFRVKI